MNYYVTDHGEYLPRYVLPDVQVPEDYPTQIYDGPLYKPYDFYNPLTHDPIYDPYLGAGQDGSDSNHHESDDDVYYDVDFSPVAGIDYYPTYEEIEIPPLPPLDFGYNKELYPDLADDFEDHPTHVVTDKADYH